jgi:hypothetical protein
MWGEEKFIEDFGGETRRKEPLGKSRCKWMDNIEMTLEETAWGPVLVHSASE